MNDLILFILMINIFASLIMFFVILRDNDNNFIKWVKHSFEVRNWFGKLQICLLIMWMTPIIIINAVVYPIALLIAHIIIFIISSCMKIVELGKKK